VGLGDSRKRRFLKCSGVRWGLYGDHPGRTGQRRDSPHGHLAVGPGEVEADEAPAKVEGDEAGGARAGEGVEDEGRGWRASIAGAGRPPANCKSRLAYRILFLVRFSSGEGRALVPFPFRNLDAAGFIVARGTFGLSFVTRQPSRTSSRSPCP